MYSREYKNLNVTVLTEEFNKKTCNYWYTVTESWAAHVAFETLAGLTRWMDERGLELTGPLTEPGTWSNQKIVGSYKTTFHMDPAVFYALPAIIETKDLGNGDYTLARITEEDGIRTVHQLNCNVKQERVIFDYFSSAKVMR